MLLLRGIVSTLFSSIRSARITRGRVSCGSITSSMKPRSAAMNGLAKRSRNSSIFCLRAPRPDLGGRADLAPIHDVHRALGAHHRDLRRRIREVHVRAQMLRSHHAIRAAVSFARDHRDLRHRRFGIGVQQLGAVPDDAAELLLGARQEIPARLQT